MANRMRGEAQMGDYTLVFTFNAMCLLEEETGLKTGDILAKMQEGIGLTDLRSFVWAGLQDRHPETTLAGAGDVIGEVGIDVALEALERGITAAFSVEKGKAPRPRKAAKAGNI